ncbi:MAG: SCO family protein [Saprospiraceae bacterium]
MLVSCEQSPQVSNKKESRVERLPYYSEATFTPHWLSENDETLDTFHQISPFKLVNQNGDTITEKTFENKIYVTDFFFTICPGICPKMTDNMLVLQDEFKDDKSVSLLSHSVTPMMDSVTVLKNYAEDKGVIADKWHLVTGDRSQIYKLGRQDYFVEEDLGLEKKADEFLHTENFVLIDKNRHIRGIYNGLNKTSIQQLIADIETLKKEG